MWNCRFVCLSIMLFKTYAQMSGDDYSKQQSRLSLRDEFDGNSIVHFYFSAFPTKKVECVRYSAATHTTLQTQSSTYVSLHGASSGVIVLLSKLSDNQFNNSRRYHDKLALRIQNFDPQLVHKNPSQTRAVNASDTKNYPYMAAIIINGRLWCAGALVDENWVVTAAHCLNYVLHVSPLKSLGQYVKVRVGSVRAHEGGVLLDVVGAVRHPKFEEEPPPHADVALLKLSMNLGASPHINIIKIYQGVKEPYAQSFVTVSGWGAVRGTDTAFRGYTPDLMSARLKVRTHHYCMDAYQLVNGFQFTPDFFCASLRNGTRDACLFDAGAPAVQQNRLMGIMSFGPERCGHEFQPAVFIKAFYFRDFVKSTIASYKTTRELIAAMEDVEPNVQAPLNIAVNEEEDMQRRLNN